MPPTGLFLHTVLPDWVQCGMRKAEVAKLDSKGDVFIVWGSTRTASPPVYGVV